MKKSFFISAPVDSQSGYGAKARDIVLSLIRSDKYDITIISQRWGNTPQGHLDKNNPDHKLILDKLIYTSTLEKQPDIWAQITIPSEMQRIGKYNILFTSGIESDTASREFIEGCNRADLVIVPSSFTKSVLQNSVNISTVTVPIEVCFEGLDTSIFKYEPSDEFDLSMIHEKFCFLFESHWLNGILGEDRKDVGMLIKVFLETFRNKPNKPALILKTSGGSYALTDKAEMIKRIEGIKKTVTGDLPNIYLIHGELTEEELNQLNNHSKVKAFVSFTKGEGWGRCLLEASVTKKPVIVSNWSGHKDFLTYGVMLDGVLRPVHQSVINPMLIQGSKWFTVNYSKAGRTLENVYKNYKTYEDSSKRQAYLTNKEFSLQKMDERINEIFKNI